MQNLKNLFQSRFFYLILAIVTITVLFLSFLFPKESKYFSTQNELTGKVLSYKIDGDFLSFVIKDKERIQCFYYFETEEEKEYFLKHFGYGVKVNLKGEMEEASSNSIPNTFNYKQYLYYQNIFYLFNVEKVEILEKEKGLNILKNNIVKILRKRENAEYLLMLVLGDGQYYDKTNIQKNGISHLFALSGMHVSFFITFLAFIFKRFGNKTNIILSFFLFFYLFLVGFTPSISRAVFLWFFCFLNDTFQFEITKKQILFLLFCSFLIIDPFIIRNLGFQYSFLISFFLLTFKNSGNYFIRIFKISFWCFLITLPITAINFYEVNVLSVFWNLLFIPFVSFIMYPFCFLYLLFPFLEMIFSFIITIFETINLWCSSIHIGMIVIPKLSCLFWIIYYIIFFLFFRTKKYSLFLLLCFFLVIGKIFPKLDSSTYVYFIDVGQGDSTLFVTPYQKEVFLIDTGGKIVFSKEPWQKRVNMVDQADTLKTFFNSLGISKIDCLIISHGDHDHAGNSSSLVHNFLIKKVIFNKGEYNELELQLIQILKEKNILYYQNIEEISNKLFFLNPKLYDNENDNSNVIYTEVNHYKFLFTGDISIKVEKDLLQKYNLNDIDILKVGHHGSKNSSDKEFIKKVNPKYSIISVGKNNRYGHPDREVLDVLDNSIVYRTDLSGSIMFQINKNRIKIKTFPP